MQTEAPDRWNGLREENERYRQNVQGEYRIIDLLRKTFELEGEAFLWELYRQVLHREPDPEGLNGHSGHIHGGTEKIRIASAMVQSEEAEEVFGRQPPSQFARSTLGGILQLFYRTNDQNYIHALYEEILCREPDPDGYNNYMKALAEGLPRRSLLGMFLQSAECARLLSAADIPSGKNRWNGESIKHIGIFLGHRDRRTWDGEGIGRFVVRLAEGLLKANPDVLIYAATTDINYADVSSLFAHVKDSFPERLLIHHSNEMEAINQNIPAQVWYVPYVGMEMASELKKPTVLTLHDLVYLHFQDLYFGRYRDEFQRLHQIAVANARNAAAVVFSSDTIREYEGQRFLGLPPERLHVVRPAAPAEEYGVFGFQDETAFRRKHNLFGEYLVYPSVIRLHKNHHRLIEAFLRFKQSEEGRQSQLKLVLTDVPAGRPLQSEIEMVLKQCPDSAAVKSVVFLGRLSSPDIPSLYKYATGTITPTLFEASCPFPVLESLMVDTPVAFSRLQIINEVIPDQSAFVTFDGYNIGEMTNAIRSLWKLNKQLVPGQKAAIAPLIARKWSDVAMEYLEVFQKAMGPA
ncbi:DUF4214 domain-containing protein [Paenibacillus tarimensis]